MEPSPQLPGATATFPVTRNVQCSVFVVSDSVIRVLFHKSNALRQPRTWMVLAPGQQDVPWAGNPRVQGTPNTAAAAAHIIPQQDGCSSISTNQVTLQVQQQPFRLVWQLPDGTQFAADRVSRPYAFGDQGQHSITHSMQRHPGDRYFGLGDKTGPMDLHGRRLRTTMTDALGYDAYRGDPLYKHWPFLIVKDGATGVAYGVLYDNMAAATFDLGCEHSNYYGRYRTYSAPDGDLDMYMILGPTIRDVVARFMQLTGRAALPPRWSLGYAATAMPLADAADAQAQIAAFLQLAQSHNVPLSAFHFGSGYTSIGPKRYVFHWNRQKFPDPPALTAAFRAAGVRLVANVKPCLLDDHPRYAEVLAAGAIVQAPLSQGPSISQFWDGEGAHLDFTNPKAVQWWQHGLRTALFAEGIQSVWNDNNEYELWDEGAVCWGVEGVGPLPIALARPLQALLMTRASYAAQVAHTPSERPYTITRAGCPGISRYAQTWSGDNTTSWQHLRWNLRTGLNMALSGMFNVGHDVGGFAGPVPSPELLVRWFQAGALHPRFITNSWKECGTVTSPWTHPEVLPLIRWTIRLRYRLMPYLYSLMWQATAAHEPPLRPLFYDFESDEACFADRDQLMFGPALMAAPVLQEGARQAEVYLPKGPVAWCDFYTEEWHAPGSTITVAAPLDRLPLFVPAGGMVVMTNSANDFSRLHDEPSRLIRVFPPPVALSSSSSSSSGSSSGGIASSRGSGIGSGSSSSSTVPNTIWTCRLFEDDGVSPLHPELPAPQPLQALVLGSAGRAGFGYSCTMLQFAMSVTQDEVRVSLAACEGSCELPYQDITVCLPAADTRRLVLAVGSPEVAATGLNLQQGVFTLHGL